MKIMKDQKREVRAWTDGPTAAPREYVIIGEREVQTPARRTPEGKLLFRATWGEEARIAVTPNELRIILRAYDEGKL